MGAKSSIEWTDATWNPTRGCSMARGSEKGGCLNCYAARFNSRNLPGLMSPTTGKPFARILDSGPRWTGEVELIESQLTLPLKWKTPRKIFVNSQSDLFHESLSDEAIDRVFLTMALCPKHTFQILTKREIRMLAYCRRRVTAMQKIRANECPSLYNAFPDYLLNVWLGVSVENQATADARIPLLLQTPAAKRFVSYEPALGPVDFGRWLQLGEVETVTEGRLFPQQQARRALHWIIVGGESGPGARPFNIQWARNTVQRCKAVGVACFVKQLGVHPQDVAFPSEVSEIEARRWQADGWTRITMDASPGPHWRKYMRLKDRKGGDMAEWPEDLRVQNFPK